MTKNHMKEFANLFSVELDEEFRISCISGIYKFTKSGLKVKSGGEWIYSNLKLIDFLIGKHEIVKLPWEPKYGDKYYYPESNFTRVSWYRWAHDSMDFAFKEAGMIFRTAEECEAALPELRKKYLGGDDNV